MVRMYDPRLQIDAIRARYDDPSWFHTLDAWHRYTASVIRDEITDIQKALTRNSKVVLNAGSGDEDFGLSSWLTLNVDVSRRRMSALRHAVIANIEELPLAAESVDAVICVGSVINYCDAAAVIAEFSRVLRPNGSLILEFESSHSADLLTQKAFGRSVGLAETFYANQQEVIWVYAPRYISNLLKAARLRINRTIPIQILSPWALLITRNADIATLLSPLDRVARYLPLLSRWASNHFWSCQKLD